MERNACASERLFDESGNICRGLASGRKQAGDGGSLGSRAAGRCGTTGYAGRLGQRRRRRRRREK